MTRMAQPPDPPIGINNLLAPPAYLYDSAMSALQDTLEGDPAPEQLPQLTKHVPDDETPDVLTAEYREKALEYVKTCREYKDTLRPDTLCDPDDLPEKIGRRTSASWVHYRSGYEVEHDKSEEKASTHEPGKYLFFAPDFALRLERVVAEQLQQRPFQSAKICTKPAQKEDWVLCLYQEDDRYYKPLREEYHDPPTIRLRQFKTNAQTRRNEYSDQFKNTS